MPSNDNSGPNNVVRDLAKALQNIILIDIYYLKEKSSKTIFGERKISLRDQLPKGYDIYHSHMFLPDLFLFLNKFRNKNIKIISTVHQKDYHNLKFDYNSRLKALFISIAWRILWCKFNAIVYLSQSMYDYYNRGLCNKTKLIVPNGRSALPERQKYDFLKNDTVYIGMMCKLTKRKNIVRLMEVLVKKIGVELIIAGDGPDLSDLKILTRNLGISERVHFLGMTSDIAKFYSSIDIFALASFDEGLPLALIDALAAGKPCLCSNIDVLKEYMLPTEVSFFDPNSTSSALSALDVLLAAKEEFSDKSMHLYRTKFTSDQMAEKYLAIYKDLC